MRTDDPLINGLIPRQFFSSPSPPPPPEPLEIPPPPPPVVIPPPPPMPTFELPPPPPPQTWREKYAMTPEIPMRAAQSKADAATAAGDPQARHLVQARSDKLRERTEIVNPLALEEPIEAPPPAPPPPSTSALEAEEAAAQTKRDQQKRRGMSASIIAGEQKVPYASSATGTGSLLG